MVCDEKVISRILIAQGYLMVPAFFLTVYINGKSQVSSNVMFSSAGILFGITILSLIALFVYPLYWGYQVRNHRVEDFGDICWWFRISLLCGVLFAVGAIAINTQFSLLLSLISLVYLLPGMIGIEAMENDLNDDVL